MTTPDESPTTAAPPARRPSVLRTLLGAVLVVILLGAAFFGGALVSAAWGVFDAFRATQETTTVRPQPGVVLAVRELSRLETATYHMERVIDLTEEQSRFWGFLETKDAILLVAAADITAGVDLSKLQDDDVRVDADNRTVKLTLPPPEILTTTLDAERTYVHTRDTDLLAIRKEDLESRARKEAKASLQDAALDAGILDRAKKGAEKAVETLLRSFGYETIEIRWR
jgi:hypothetical protein